MTHGRRARTSHFCRRDIIILMLFSLACSCGRLGSHRLRQLVLIVIDGATWDVITPMIRENGMQVFKELQQTGCWGDLESLEDPISSSVWTSAASGKLPSKHGVYDFNVDRYSVRTKRLWEMAAERKGTVGLYRYLVTWPPYDAYRFCVPDWLARDDKTYPSAMGFIVGMHRTLKATAYAGESKMIVDSAAAQALGLLTADEVSRFTAETAGDQNPTSIMIKDLRLGTLIDQRAFISLYRANHPDFAAFGHYEIDLLSHKFFHAVVQCEAAKARGQTPSKELQQQSDYITSQYQLVDSAAGQILQALAPETTVMIFSDHGFKADDLGGKGAIVSFNPQALFTCLGLGKIAYISIAYYTYFSPEQFSSGRLPGIKSTEDFMDLLKTIKTGNEETALLRVGLSRDGMVYCCLNPEDPLGIETLRCGTCSIPAKEVLKVTTGTGSHAHNGILLMRGPGIRRGIQLTGAQICDIAPTALAIMGLPIADDMDGRVLEDAFEPDFLARHPVTRIASYDDREWLLQRKNAEHEDQIVDEEIRNHFETLGYITADVSSSPETQPGTLKCSITSGDDELPGAIEVHRHEQPEPVIHGDLGSPLQVSAGTWDIAAVAQINHEAQQFSFLAVPVGAGRATLIKHDLKSREVRVIPAISSRGMSFGDNASLYIFKPGERNHRNAVAAIRSGQEETVNPGIYDLEYHFGSGVPCLIKRYVEQMPLVAGTTYRLGLDLDAELIRVYVMPSPPSGISSGKVAYFGVNASRPEREAELNRMVLVQPNTYDLIITWQDAQGVRWQLAKRGLSITGQHGEVKRITFDPEDAARSLLNK